MRITRLSIVPAQVAARFPALALVLAASCGGSQKPAETSADTSSLESKESSPPKAETPAPSESTAAATPAPASSAEAPAPAPAHPSPSVTGTIDGKPFQPKIARTTGKAQKDGRIVLALDDAHSDCATAAAAQPGDATLTMLVPWEDGYKVDLGALKRSTPKKAGGEITFSRVGAGGKKEISATFKPSGTVTIVKAPNDPNATGKMKIDLQSGDFMLAGDLDVLVCGPTK
jgi:hypothetical protein